MVATTTILCVTVGEINASTAVALLNPMEGVYATIPEGAVIKKIDIYRDGDAIVTGGCTMQLGVVGNLSKYIVVGEGLSTTDLNNGHLIHKYVPSDKGLAANTELRLTLNNALTTGTLVFEITYATYA